MYEKIGSTVSMFLIPMFLCSSAFANPVALPSPDYLTDKEFSLYGNLDCNNPDVVAKFVWIYSEYLTPKEECGLYVTAAKIMHTKIGIVLEANVTI
jgi:hypothetical protein